MVKGRLVAAFAFASAAAACGGDKAKPAAALTPEQAVRVVALENKGIGALERYDYNDAVEPLREACRLAPSWIPGRFNLALALIHAARGSLSDAAPMPEGTPPGVSVVRLTGGDAITFAEAHKLPLAKLADASGPARSGLTVDEAKEAARRDADAVVLDVTASPREILDGILKEAPGNPYANFMGAWLAERAGPGQEERALKLYRAAYTVTGKDPVVGAKYGGFLARIDGREKDAVAILEESRAKRPTLIASVYQLMLLCGRTGDEAKAKKYLDELNRLNGKVRPGVDRSTMGQQIQDAYGNMGPYSMAMRDFGVPPAYPASSAGEVTAAAPAPLCAWKAGALTKYAAFLGCAVLDYDQDGLPDLFVCGGEGPCGLLHNEGGGKFTDVASQAGVAVTGVYAVAAGDFDVEPTPNPNPRPCRRAKVGLVLVRDDGLTYLANTGGGKFEDRTKDSGLADDPGGARAILAVDADQEGDLDLFLSGGYGQGNRLWANAGPGKFKEVAEAAGVKGDFKGYGPAAVLDFDDDADLDLLVTRPEAPPVLFANDRGLKFHEVPLSDPLPVAAFGACAWGDRLVLTGETGATWVRPSGASIAGRVVPGAPGGPAVSIDPRGAGLRDLVFADGTWLPAGQSFGPSPFGDPQHLFDSKPGTNIVAFDADGDGAEDVILVRPGESPQIVRFGCKPRGRFLVADFEGVIRNDVQAGWSNLEGRGALVEVKAGADLQKFRIGNPCGFGCSPPTRLVAGLGASSQADFVRILWPDAVQHAVLDLPAGQVNCIVEEQRRPDSCPLLFSWDGAKYAFVTDFLGVGGIGFLVAPGVYGAPDPTESVKVDASMVRPRKDGKLSFRVVEAMEETCYLDRADLQVVDHPADVTVYPDERFAGEPPFPNGDLVAYRREILPVVARDRRGDDVTDRILTVDRRYPDAFKLHPRLLGATEEQVLDLDFGDRLRDVTPGDGIVLCANGWIEYGYTRTSVAAAGEGFSYVGPLLESSPDGGKTWTTIVPNLGYPAGFPRVMTYDLTGKVSRETPRLRIRTNYEIYWDRVWLAPKVDAAKETRVTVLPPSSADLRWAGYPREYSPDGKAPRIYDYQTMDPSAPWKTMSGDFTRYGDVLPLLAKTDDEFAIFGKGEEIELLFDPARLPPLPDGWKRSYVLRFDGYCKGQELYTAHGWTVEPLPFHAMSNYPYRADERYPDDAEHRRYRAEWNTRHVEGVTR
jgi:Tfp pilus assembly protein PilF